LYGHVNRERRQRCRDRLGIKKAGGDEDAAGLPRLAREADGAKLRAAGDLFDKAYATLG
jgi:hypothetical protein